MMPGFEAARLARTYANNMRTMDAEGVPIDVVEAAQLINALADILHSQQLSINALEAR